MKGSGKFQFSQAQVYVFSLAAFVFISYLTHFIFAKTSVVDFAELCILLCYEVLKFWLRVKTFV